MTKKLEELFDLPLKEDSADDALPGNDIETNLPVLPDALEKLDKIEAALPAVRGLEASDAEMDDLAAKATESFNDLMDLGMNVDSRYASEIFSVASTLLGHAITAKTAKLNKKLKMVELQLKKARMDRDTAGDEPAQTAHGQVLSRNDLLDMIKGTKDQNNNKA